jgi:hypothetical protein
MEENNMVVEWTEEEIKKARQAQHEYKKVYMKKYVDKNRKKIYAQQKKWLTPEKRNEYQTRYWLKKALENEKALALGNE